MSFSESRQTDEVDEVDKILREHDRRMTFMPMRIDRCWRNWLEKNFHPIVARYQYMLYIVQVTNQNLEDGFLDVSSEDQIAEHMRSYAGGGVLHPKARTNDRELLKLLIAQVTRLALPINVMVQHITSMITTLIDSQSDLVNRLSDDKKAGLGRVLTAQLMKLNLNGTEGFMANHYQYVEQLYGPGSAIMQALAPFAAAIDVHLFDTKTRHKELKGTGILWKHDPFSDESWDQDVVVNLNGEKGYLDALPLDLRTPMMSFLFFNDIDRCFSKIQLAALQMASVEGVKLVIRQAYNHFLAREEQINQDQFGSILSSAAQYNTVHADGYNNIVMLEQMHERYLQATEQAYAAKVERESKEAWAQNAREAERADTLGALYGRGRTKEGEPHDIANENKIGEKDHPNLPVVKRARQGEGTTEISQTQRPTKRAKTETKEEKTTGTGWVPFALIAALAGVVIYRN